jgi:transposase
VAALAAGIGLRERADLLAPPAGLAGGGRLGAPPCPRAELARRCGGARLGPREPRQPERPGEKRGAQTGPSPVDRGKRGSKDHLVVDRRGVPLAVALSAATTHDSLLLEDVIDAIPPIVGPRGRPGRPRRRPGQRHADKGYDYPRCRQALRARGLVPRIARRGVASSERLGRHRWVVERTLAWLLGCRRLGVRYERRPDLLLGFLHLACTLICLRFLA